MLVRVSLCLNFNLQSRLTAPQGRWGEGDGGGGGWPVEGLWKKEKQLMDVVSGVVIVELWGT